MSGVPGSTGEADPPWPELTHLFEATADCADATSAVAVTAELALDILEADGVSVRQVEPERALVRTLATAGVLAPGALCSPAREKHALSELPWLDRLVPGARPRRLTRDDVDIDPVERALLTSAGRYAAVAVPVVLDGRVWGEIDTTRVSPPGFTERDGALLGAIGAHLGTLLGLLQRTDRRAAHTRVDPLTGLPRRDAAERLVASCPDGVVLAALDLDRLKKVNDEFGHAAGDRLLVDVAGVLETATAHLPDRVVSRSGGNGFLVTVPGTDVDAVHQACERARQRVAGMGPDMGLSCGIAGSTDLIGDLGSGRPLIRLADATLNRAKRTGAGVLRAWHARGVSPSPSPEAGTPDAATATWLASLARLRVPVDVFARSVDAAAWWISQAPAGTGTIVTRDCLVLRDRREEPGLTLLGAVYELEHLPWKREVLQGGSRYVGVNDPEVHATEQLFLAELNYTGNLMAGSTGRDGDGWLLEISCDPVTAQLDRMGDSLLQLLRRALGMPAT